MARPKGQTTKMTGRAPMRSPGRPGVGRDVQRSLWAEVAKGLPSEDAALGCGVSPAVGTRWFRENGRMPQINLTVSGRYLSFAEREEIALMRAQDVGVREIARRLGRSASTISRELRRNTATRGGMLHYRASSAQWKAERQARRPKPAKNLRSMSSCAPTSRRGSRDGSKAQTDRG
jgi:transposase-like protein